jgi:hypothetical protein
MDVPPGSIGCGGPFFEVVRISTNLSSRSQVVNKGEPGVLPPKIILKVALFTSKIMMFEVDSVLIVDSPRFSV